MANPIDLRTAVDDFVDHTGRRQAEVATQLGLIRKDEPPRRHRRKRPFARGSSLEVRVFDSGEEIHAVTSEPGYEAGDAALGSIQPGDTPFCGAVVLGGERQCAQHRKTSQDRIWHG